MSWRGRELFESDGWPYELSEPEANALAALAERTENRDPESITRAEAKLPALADLATRLSHELEEGAGVVLLRGLPLDARALWALTLQLGTPVSQSAEGQRLFPVRDAGYAPGDSRFRGPMSNKRLSFHTDRCDVIAFLCIQPAAEGGDTFVVSSVALRDELRRRAPAVLETLSRPYPYLRHTVDLGNQRPYCELPIFSERDGFFGAHFLRVLIDRADQSADAPNLTEEQRAALDTLEALAEDPAMHASFRMALGDVLLLNNWTTFHRRSEFIDAPEPECKRHLLRVWLSMDNSRPIDPSFADHFGATEAGTLRGGMHPLA
ncbi:MAG: TauD/TfdA family dioxygenase [Acidobacteria bacterium]|nr:TauD/TfdA family dioxygenase [Acidobacteriota bacterium]MDA1235616.1 TauD/TfdA family dioxygenase [Acidobacteriota bacterium]